MTPTATNNSTLYASPHRHLANITHWGLINYSIHTGLRVGGYNMDIDSYTTPKVNLKGRKRQLTQ